MGERFNGIIEGEWDVSGPRVPWQIDEDEFVVLGEEWCGAGEFCMAQFKAMEENDGRMVRGIPAIGVWRRGETGVGDF
jgi:hypothetical protein